MLTNKRVHELLEKLNNLIKQNDESRHPLLFSSIDQNDFPTYKEILEIIQHLLEVDIESNKRMYCYICKADLNWPFISIDTLRKNPKIYEIIKCNQCLLKSQQEKEE